MTDQVDRRFILNCDASDPSLSGPRTCNLLARVNVAGRGDCWLSEVDPPFPGGRFGLGSRDISKVIVATKWQGDSLFDCDRNSIPVYVARIVDELAPSSETVRADQLELMLWGVLACA